MVTLSNATLGALPPRVTWAGYDRARVTAGIVHFSVGNFHRAHQAVYLDRLIAAGGHDGWGSAASA
jgi:mannitol 2-dehydrogenase